MDYANGALTRFLAAWVQKRSQNKPDTSIVEAFSTQVGPGGHQRGSENQQKNKNLQEIANTKMCNYRNVLVSIASPFLSKTDGQTVAGILFLFLKTKKSDREVNNKRTHRKTRKNQN